MKLSTATGISFLPAVLLAIASGGASGNAAAAGTALSQQPPSASQPAAGSVAEVHSLSSIDLVEIDGGSQLRVRSSAPMETSTARAEPAGLRVTIPLHRPGDLVSLRDLRTDLISSVEISEQATSLGPGTSILLRSQGATDFQAFRQGQVLWIDIRRQRPETTAGVTSRTPSSPSAAAAPTTDTETALAECETQSRQLSLAVAELVEERAILNQRLESLADRSQSLERQVGESLGQLEKQDSARENEIRELAARLAESRESEAALQERVVQLTASVQANARQLESSSRPSSREQALETQISSLQARVVELSEQLGSSRAELSNTRTAAQAARATADDQEEAQSRSEQERLALEAALARVRQESAEADSARVEAERQRATMADSLEQARSRIAELENRPANPNLISAEPGNNEPGDAESPEPPPRLISATPSETEPSSGVAMTSEESAADRTATQAYGTVMVVNPAKLRAGPSTQAEIASRLLPGTLAQIQGNQNGWYQVALGQSSGWIYRSLVREVGDNHSALVDGITTANVVLRTEDGHQGEQIALLPPGTELLVVESGPEWSEVLVGVERGWVSSSFLRQVHLSAESRPEATIVAEVNLRSGPSATYRARSILRAGQRGHLVGRSGAWMQVEVGARSGWVYHSFVALGSGWGDDLSSPERLIGQAATTRDRLQLRSGPAPTYATSQVLMPGSQVAILAAKGNWLRVEVEGERGWLHRDYLNLADGDGS